MFARFNRSIGLWEAYSLTRSRFTGRWLVRSVYTAESLRGLKGKVRRAARGRNAQGE